MILEVQEDIDTYVRLLEKISEKVDSSNEAVAILEQIGKDRRTKFIQNGMNQESDAPATDKQLRYLERLGVECSDGLTKKEASELIEENK